MARQNYTSGAKWEATAGYSRAVRVGSRIYISGTTAVDGGGNVIGQSDPYKQAVRVLTIIENILQEAGARLSDVVRTRMYVTDMENADEIIRAHAEYFGDIRPASTLVEVQRLIEPELLIEIEADAEMDT